MSLSDWKRRFQAIPWLDLSFKQAHRWPREAQAIALVTIALSTWLLSYGLMARPYVQLLAQNEADITAMKLSYKSQYIKARTFRTLETELEAMKEQWHHLSADVPHQEQLSDWVAACSQRIIDVGLTMRSIRLKPSILTPGVERDLLVTPLELSVDGTYFPLTQFITALYELPGALIVQDFSLTTQTRFESRAQDSADPPLTLTLMASVHHQVPA